MPSSAPTARLGCSILPLAVAQAGFRLPTHAEVAPSPALLARVVLVPGDAKARGFSHVVRRAFGRWPGIG